MVTYPAIGREEFMGKIRTLFGPSDCEQIEAAYVFAKYGHRGQLRDDVRIRYFEHPKAVAWIILDEIGIADCDLIVLALLHDLVEDSFLLSKERVALNFGEEVLEGLLLLSKNCSSDYYARLMEADWKVVMVKICDRLHNLRTLSSCKPEKRIRKIKETRDYYLPLCDRLIEIVPGSYFKNACDLKKQIGGLLR